MTVHEVAADPDHDLFYVSHYALGMRVLAYSDAGFEEVGRFVEAGGSNYWGVEVHRMNGQTYILGSDRDRGLRIFSSTRRTRRISPSERHGAGASRPRVVLRGSARRASREIRAARRAR